MSSPAARGHLALVLHAHLPWAAASDPDSEWPLTWLCEALWESYLPLLALCKRLAERRPARPLFNLFVSPTLLTMLGDPDVRARARAYFDELAKHLDHAGRRALCGPDALTAHRERLEASRAAFEAANGDVFRAFLELEERGVLELGTTAATHAFLPGLLTPSAVRAQLRMGMRVFAHYARRPPRALWLPECGFDERLLDEIVDCGAAYSVLEAHGVNHAMPRPPRGTRVPILCDGPYAFFGRDADLCERVWSPEKGYPAAPIYREFHRPLQGDKPGAADPRIAGALKPWAIDGRGYQPDAARARARADADHFVAHVEERLLAEAPADASRDAPTVLVAAFDAELFGHWWWEGPDFLERVLERLGADERSTATSLGAYLAADPVLPVSLPATSSWGRGGYAGVWTHPTSSHAARVAHRGERRVLALDALVRDNPRSETQREARLWAIRELFLLQSSDYAFMLRAREFDGFAERRLRQHATRLEALLAIAERPKEEPGDREAVARFQRERPLFPELGEDAWADAFDPW